MIRIDAELRWWYPIARWCACRYAELCGSDVAAERAANWVMRHAVRVDIVTTSDGCLDEPFERVEQRDRPSYWYRDPNGAGRL